MLGNHYPMANIGYFDIPADNVDRAKHFYRTLLGWKIEPTKAGLDKEKAIASQYQDICLAPPWKAPSTWVGCTSGWGPRRSTTL